MILNDKNNELKRMVMISGKREYEIAKDLGKSACNVSKRLHSNTPNSIPKGFVELCEYLGYDIRLKYIPKN